jgi:predicted lipoprotein with Yx(FWY)xxD motif
VRDQLAPVAGGRGRQVYTIITRDDGAKQWAYKGKPLYLWIKDTKPGDRTGDGFNNAWRLARS